MQNLNTQKIAVFRCRHNGYSKTMFTNERFYTGFKEKGKEDLNPWWVIDNLGHQRCILANEGSTSFGTFELVGIMENNLPEIPNYDLDYVR